MTAAIERTQRCFGEEKRPVYGVRKVARAGGLLDHLVFSSSLVFRVDAAVPLCRPLSRDVVSPPHSNRRQHAGTDPNDEGPLVGS